MEVLKLLKQKNEELIEKGNTIIEKNKRLIEKNKLIIQIIKCVETHSRELAQSEEGRSFLKDFNFIFAKEK